MYVIRGINDPLEQQGVTQLPKSGDFPRCSSIQLAGVSYLTLTVVKWKFSDTENADDLFYSL